MNLRDIVHADAAKETKKSWAWYETNVRNAAAGMSAQKFLGDNVAHQINKKGITPGDMISFFYDPKTKDKLPYFDTFPMVLPFAISPDGSTFTGLNLHYLKPVVRATLLSALMKYVDDDKMGPKTKIKASWDILKSAAGSGVAEHCVKKYLFKNVKSSVIVIPPIEWSYVVFLPLERFKNATNEEVWRNH